MEVMEERGQLGRQVMMELMETMGLMVLKEAQEIQELMSLRLEMNRTLSMLTLFMLSLPKKK